MRTQGSFEVNTETTIEKQLQPLLKTTMNACTIVLLLVATTADTKTIPHFEDAVLSLSFTERQVSLLWPRGVIPFDFAPSITSIPEGQKIVGEAMKEWMTHTWLKFIQRTTEKDYILFHYHKGCMADVGYRQVGQQVVTLGQSCFHKSKILHELGHTIGFWHEQSRPDRDKYVEIFEENIRPEYLPAFDRYSFDRIDTFGLPYDYESIMHYKMTAATKNGGYTILPKRKDILRLGNDELSSLDMKKTNLMYKCHGWTTWSSWEACDKSCGGGSQKRTRKCTSSEEHHCHGDRVEKRSCNLNTCPDWPDFPSDFFFGDNEAFSSFTLQHLRVHRHKKDECVLTYETQNLVEWSNHMFCNMGHRHINMKWSDSGPVEGMKCTHIVEPRERLGWKNTYLCLPPDTPYNLTWSHQGKKANSTCVRWFAKGGTDGWNNNYLCTKGNGTVITGSWSQWTTWSECKTKCGSGKRYRVRSCTNPRPQNGGQRCIGLDYDEGGCMKPPCASKVCGGELTGSRGSFLSPGFPSNYPNNINCTWTITARPLKNIYVTITSMDIEQTMGTCHFDYLKIKNENYNGKVLGTYCGNKLPSIILSSANTVWISFVTDGEGSRSGFSASWFHD